MSTSTFASTRTRYIDVSEWSSAIVHAVEEAPATTNFSETYRNRLAHLCDRLGLDLTRGNPMWSPRKLVNPRSTHRRYVIDAEDGDDFFYRMMDHGVWLRQRDVDGRISRYIAFGAPYLPAKFAKLDEAQQWCGLLGIDLVVAPSLYTTLANSYIFQGRAA